MIRSLSFKADPPIPFHTYSYHLKKAFKEGYIDDQLNSEAGSGIIRQVLNGLTELFEIPEDYHLVLLQDYSSMVRMLASLARSRIVVAGSSMFSDRFIKYTEDLINIDILNEDIPTMGSVLFHKDLKKERTGKSQQEDLTKEKATESPQEDLSKGKTAESPQEDLTKGKTAESPQEDLTKGKTIESPQEDLSSKDTGQVSLIIQDINPLTGRKFHPDNLEKSLDPNRLSFSHLDISFSSPTDALDYENFQSFSFRTKYGFGMDQDMVVWIMKDDLFDILTEKFSGIFMEYDPGFLNSKKCIIQHELQIRRIYILGRIIQDFLNRGLTIIRNEIKYKSIILYNSISDNPNLDPLVIDPHWQSQNILCANTEISGEKLYDFMSRNKIEFDVFRGSDANSIIRVANYPVHSKEQVEFFVDLIEKL